MLFDFSQSQNALAWRSIDDRVMGGVSRSNFTAKDDDGAFAVFSGFLSLDNNGGFCSVRADLNQAIPASAEHIWIECRNNMSLGSKDYYLNLRTSDTFDGISYRTAFRPIGTFARYECVEFEFTPVFRGRSVIDAPALELTKVRQVGLMVADAQVGPFELEIRAIGVF